MRRPTLVPVAGALLLATVTLAGCTGDDEGGDTPSDDLGTRMDTARAALDDAESLELTLSTDALPDGVAGLLEADGVGNHDPAFEGTVTVETGGLGTIDADVVAVDGEVYAELPFTQGMSPIDPDDFGAPDPAGLVDADNGVSSWLTDADDLADEGDTRDGEDVLTGVSGSLSGSVVAVLVPSADAEALFDVEFRLTDDDVLRDATITGPFYPGGDDVTYELAVETSDDTVDISAP